VSAERPDQIPDPDGSSVGVFSYERPPYRPRWWLHGLLFALTLLTTTIFGALFAGNPPEALLAIPFPLILIHPLFLAEGLKFSLPLITILLAHEMGHYVVCRRHGLQVTPPFFIPAPIGIGTFGAVIRIREPIRDSRQLLDIGAAGPIAGFVVALPFLFFGIAASEITAALPETGYLLFGEPLAFRIVSGLIHPGLPPEADMLLHPTAMAAWFGLLVTALNMLPFAQLDGGHVAYALFGRHHRKAAWPMLFVLFLLGFRWPGWWIWTVIALLMGVVHPRIWDEDRPLDPRRKLVGWLALLILALTFMPQPITLVF